MGRCLALFVYLIVLMMRHTLAWGDYARRDYARGDYARGDNTQWDDPRGDYAKRDNARREFAWDECSPGHSIIYPISHYNLIMKQSIINRRA